MNLLVVSAKGMVDTLRRYSTTMYIPCGNTHTLHSESWAFRHRAHGRMLHINTEPIFSAVSSSLKVDTGSGDATYAALISEKEGDKYKYAEPLLIS